MRVPTFAALLLPLGDVQAATTSSSVSSASSYVPWSLADNKTSLTIIESQLTMCTYSKVEECIQDPKLVSELGALYRAPGYCIAMDSAYVNITTTSAAIPNRYYPTSVEEAYDTGFSNKFSEWSDTNREQFEVDCPLLYNETIALGEDMLCCTESQYTGLSTQVRMIPGLCSACKENLRNIFCQFTCNPNNSMFLDINEVRIMSGDDEHEGQIFPAVEEATYYVGKDWIRDIYDFCEDDSSFSLLCNPNQDCTDGYGLMEYMGKYAYNSIGSPEQINVTTMDKFSEEIQMTEFCHCDDANETNCMSPMNNKMTSCVGVCGSLCAVSSDDTRTYTDACYGAESASVSGSGSVAGSDSDSTWAELNEYLATNIPETDWAPLNYFLVIFGGVVGILIIVGFIVAILRERRYNAVDRRSGTPQVIGPDTPDFHGVASAMAGSTGYLSFLDDFMTKKLRLWAAFVSKGNRPKKIIPMVLVVVVVCAVGLYNIDIETDPIKLWVSTSSTSYEERQHYGDIFNPFYRSEQIILVPKDGGSIYRSSILKEAIHVQNVAANVTYTSDDGEETIALDDICWKATGTGCTVNSITQYFQNNMEHFEFYEKYGWRWSTSATACTLQRRRMWHFALSSRTLWIMTTRFLNEPAIKWEREYIKTMKKEVEANTVFDVYFYAEISVQDEVDAESSNGMGPVALSYCLMLIYISLGINRFKFSPESLVGLEHNPKAIEEITTIVSESLAYIGPSIFMASAAESVAFAFGSISAMPVVLWFAAMACCAVAINFCFQMTFFLSVLTLDKRRELSGKYDIIFKRASSVTAQVETIQQSSEPLVSLEPKTPAADDVRPSVTPEKHSLTQVLDYCVDVYASILTHKLVKMIVLLAFLAWTLWSIYSMETLDQGLPQKEAMPSNSYMIEYFNALDVYLATGSPVYFVVETSYGRNPASWSLNDESVETIFCKSKDICGTYSIPNIMNALANHGDESVTHISPGTTYSWMDDFWGFVNPDKTVPPVPEDEYMSLFSMFATASAGTSCSYGGGSIYRGQFSIDTDPIPTVTSSTPAVKINSSGYGDEITAWSYMQYLTIIHDAYELIGLSLAAIFVITTLYLGNVFYSLVISLTATNIVVLVLGLMQPLDIMLNGLSIVNLIIAAGISVEFCGHYVRFFAKANGTGDERARDALRQVFTSVILVSPSPRSSVSVC
ncbi:Niemann-Pick C1, N-terminal [Phytophthora cactorum]|nr:Niemann-Pick C1, N-terminal [Phytophthora cactorum]